MTKQVRITKAILKDKELLKAINKSGYGNEAENISSFVMNAERYIKAIKSGRMCCIITSVSKSGMSRNIKFIECTADKTNANYLNFFQLFTMLGYTPTNNERTTFRIGGCGMDMIFHTNYSIIHQLKQLGFISKKQCDVLAQRTPVVL